MKKAKQQFVRRYNHSPQQGDKVRFYFGDGKNTLFNGVVIGENPQPKKHWQSEFFVQVVTVPSDIPESRYVGKVYAVPMYNFAGYWLDSDVPGMARQNYTEKYRAMRKKWQIKQDEWTEAQKAAYASYVSRNDEFIGWTDIDRAGEFENPGLKLQEIYDRACKNFPHELEYNLGEYGDLYDSGNIEFSGEWSFEYGKLGNNDTIEAGGRIYVRRDGKDVTIDCLFALYRNGDWRNPDARIGGEYDYLQAWYDIDRERWSDLTLGSI